MNRLIFHIGIPKTGSSALQVSLAKNADALEALSIDYLKIGDFALGAAGRISSGNGAHLARSLLPARTPSRMPDAELHITQFFATVAASKCEIGIVSSELFVGADREMFRDVIRRLRIRGIKPEFFYYVRAQEELLCSGYLQQIKRHACTDTPEQYVKRTYRSIPYLKYHSFYRSLCEAAGSENVHCLRYEASAVGGPSIYEVFLREFGINSARMDLNTPAVNTGISAQEAALMLAVNRFRPRMRFSDLVVENSLQSGSPGIEPIYRLLSPDLVSEIREYFATENSRLSTECFGTPDPFIKPNLEYDCQSLGLDIVCQDDVIGFFGGLMVRFDERLSRLEQRINAVVASRDRG